MESSFVDLNCCICLNQMKDNANKPITLLCGHSLCMECYPKQTNFCPICKKKHTKCPDPQPSFMMIELLTENQKLKQMVLELGRVKKIKDADIKCERETGLKLRKLLTERVHEKLEGTLAGLVEIIKDYATMSVAVEDKMNKAINTLEEHRKLAEFEYERFVLEYKKAFHSIQKFYSVLKADIDGKIKELKEKISMDKIINDIMAQSTMDSKVVVTKIHNDLESISKTLKVETSEMLKNKDVLEFSIPKIQINKMTLLINRSFDLQQKLINVDDINPFDCSDEELT